MYPRRSPSTHTEQIGDEASVYDWQRGKVHALNPTAARVWRLCDGATSSDAIAAAVRVEMGVLEADAVVSLTLRQLARVHLLELPVEPRGDRPATTRRWLLSRGVAAAMLPAIYSIVAPFPVEAQSPGRSAPTLTSVSPNQATRGTTVAVTLTGTNFLAGATVAVSGAGVTVSNVVVGSTTSLSADFALDPAAADGPRTVTVSNGFGTSGGLSFTINPSAPSVPTLIGVSPNQATRGTAVAVVLTGTNFVAGATTVAVSGAGVTVGNVVVGSTTSLNANFVLDSAAADGPRTVTVTTAAGMSGGVIFTINPPVPTLTSVSPNQGLRGTTVPVVLTGTNFVVGATTVAVSGAGVMVSNVVVGSTTSLNANFVLDLAAAGPRTVTVTTAGGTSGAQIFTITLPPPGFEIFAFTGTSRTFTVPAGVSSILIEAIGAAGGAGAPLGTPGRGGRAVARVSVTPGTALTVLVGGQGQDGSGVSSLAGGFNGGGPTTGADGGSGGGATSVRNGATPLVIAGGGGGSGKVQGGSGGNGGDGGGLEGLFGQIVAIGGRPGGGGTQVAGGVGGAGDPSGSLFATAGTAGVAGTGGTGGSDPPLVGGGGGGGGGYFGGGGGGGGFPGAGGGGGGSSFTAPGAINVVHQQGFGTIGSVIISW